MTILTTGEKRTMAIYRTESDIEPLVLDAVFEPRATRDAQVSRYAIENGSSLGDHITRAPRTIQWRAILVNEPVDADAARDRAKATIVPSADADPNNSTRLFGLVGRDFRDPLVSARINGPQVDEARAAGLLAQLVAIYDGNEPVEVYTPFEAMPYAVLRSLVQVPIAQGSAIEVSGTWESLRIANTASAAVAPAQRPAPSRRALTPASAQSPTSQGTRSAPTVTNQSILSKSLDVLGVFQ